MVMSSTRFLDRLPQSLASAAGEHLSRPETVLAATYLLEIKDPGNVRWHRAAAELSPSVPGRALIVTNERVLVLDDPDDRATTTAAQQYLVASCPLDVIVCLELRSYLLDCALTLVVASTNGTRRVSIGYNGVHEPEVLAAIARIRRASDAPLLRSCVASGSDTPNASVHDPSPAIAALNHRHRYFLRKFLTPEEPVEWAIATPSTPRRAGLSFRGHGLPALLLAKTNRQILVVRDAQRRLRGRAPNGCDAWLLPLDAIAAAEERPGQRDALLVFELGRAASRYTVDFAVPVQMAAEVAAIAGAIPRRHDQAGHTDSD